MNCKFIAALKQCHSKGEPFFFVVDWGWVQSMYGQSTALPMLSVNIVTIATFHLLSHSLCINENIFKVIVQPKIDMSLIY